MNDEILKYLKEYPAFRERSAKGKWIAGIVLKKYGIELTPKVKDQLQDIFTDISNADRYWRLHTSENPELQGTDYGTRSTIEAEKQIELGYVPGHTADLKKLATLT